MYAPAMDTGHRPRFPSAIALLLGLLVCAPILWAAPRQLDAYRWQGVDRIVAIGDLHGDYGHYLAVLQAAGVVDRRGRWIAGDTHLVQTGDIPDRGPDTRRIIAHMAALARQARKRGGRVHNLLGNHEAMNVYGDLRYVDPGEYRAFADQRSAALRDRYYEASMEMPLRKATRRAMPRCRPTSANSGTASTRSAGWNTAPPGIRAGIPRASCTGGRCGRRSRSSSMTWCSSTAASAVPTAATASSR